MTVYAALKQFCQTTSIKGLPRMIKASVWSLRIMWALCVIFGSAVALYQIIYIMKAYFEYETSTTIEELEGEETIFPDVTVCKTNPPPILTEPDAPGITLDEYLYTISEFMQNASRVELDTLEEFHSLDGYFQTITDKYVFHQTSRNMTVNCVFRYRNDDDYNCSDSSFAKPRFLTPSFPACITFKPPNFEDRRLIQSLSVVLYLDDFLPHLVPNFGSDVSYPQTAGIEIFIHAPNTFPNLLTGIVGSPGWETAVKIIDVRRMRAEDPYSNCNGAPYDKIDEDADFSYTESTCRHNCTQVRAISECGCLDPRAPTFSSQRLQYAFCGMLNGSKEEMVNRLQCLYNDTDVRNDDCDEHCVEKCTSLDFEYHSMGGMWPHESRQLAFYNKYIKGFGYPSEFNVYDEIEREFESNPRAAYKRLQTETLLKRNFLKVKVYFDGRNVLQYRDSPVHTPSSVSGSLGGILNLWIGISFVTAIEIAELFYNIISNMFKRDNSHEDDEQVQSPHSKNTQV